MNVTTAEFGFPGERDEDGFCGYYLLGTQYLFVEGADFLVALRFASSPQEVVLAARRHRGQEVPLSTCPTDSFLQAVVEHLRREAGVRQVKTFVGVAAAMDQVLPGR